MVKEAAKPEFPPRLFTNDDEPDPDKSINYFSGNRKLLDAVMEALNPDEWEEIQNSNLGVFLKFHQQDVSWASRLVHWIITFQLVCNKKHEIWSLIGVTPIRFSIHEFKHITGLNCDYVENLMYPEVEETNEMREFWERLGVSFEFGPSYEDLYAATKLCVDWERLDRLRLGYLAFLAGYIDAHSHTQGCNLLLSRMVMNLDRFVKYPWGRVTFEKLITSVKEKESDLTKAAYTINGFIQALQAWGFLCYARLCSRVWKATCRFIRRTTPVGLRRSKMKKILQEWHA